MRFTYKDQVEKTDLAVCGAENLVQINEFHWDIGHKEIISPFSYDWQAVHSPFRVTMEVNKHLPLLYKLKCSCDTDYFDMVEVFWVEFNPKKSQDSIYFKHTFQPVKVWNIRQFYDNVKTPDFERNGHLVEIDFRYRFTTILYVNGFQQVGKYEWKLFLVEFQKYTTCTPEEAEWWLTAPMDSDILLDELEALAALEKIFRIFNPKWQHQSDERHKESPKEVKEGDTIRLSVQLEEARPNDKVSFKVTSKGKEQKQCVAFLEAPHSNGSSSVEWKVDLSNLKDKENIDLAFEASSVGGKAVEVKIPYAQPIATCPLEVEEYAIENFRRLIGLPWDDDRIEVFDPADSIDNLNDPFKPCTLPYKGANNDGRETDTPTIPLDKKWLYAFSTKGKKQRVTEAFAVADQDGTTKYQHVRWDNPESLKGIYPRELEKEKEDGFLVPADYDTVVFISDHQLTFERIQEYQSDGALLKKRGLQIKGADLKKDSPAKIVLPDIVGLGEHLAYRHAKCAVAYTEYLEEEENRLKNPDEASRRQFGKMLQELSDKYPVVKANIHYDKLVEYNTEFERSQEERKLTLDWFCKMLCNWLKTESFKATRDDYSGNDELEEAIIEREAAWTENILRTESGIEFVTQEANDPESWYYRVNEGTIQFKQILPSSRFTNKVREALVGLKLTVLQGKVNSLIQGKFEYKAKAQKYIWESTQALNERNAALQEFRALRSKSIITKSQLRARKKLVKHEIEKLLKSHDLSLDISTNIDFINENSDHLLYNCGLKPTGKQKIITEKATKSVQAVALENAAKEKIQEAGVMKSRAALAEFEAEEIRGQIDSIKGSALNSIGRMVFVAVEQINLVLAVKNFKDTWDEGDAVQNTFEAVSTFGALVDASTTFEIVVDALTPNEQPLHTQRLWGKGLKGLNKLPARQIVLYKIDIVSGVCDIIGCAYSIAKYWEDQKKKQIIGESLILIGKAIGVTSAGYALFAGKAVSDVIFLGITTGGWGFIASGVVLAGALIAYLLREQPLRDWARQCPFNNLSDTIQLHDAWGKKEVAFDINTYRKNKKEAIDVQRQKLFAILAEFEAEITTALRRKQALPNDLWKFEEFRIRISPQAIQKDKSKVWVNIKITADKSIYSSEFTVLDDSVILDHERNCFNGNTFLTKPYTLKEIEALAKRKGYYNKKVEEFLTHLSYKEYVSQKIELSDQLNGYYLYSDYEIKAEIQARLDYEGNQNPSLLSTNQENSGLLLVPIKGAENVKRRNPKYEFL